MSDRKFPEIEKCPICDIEPVVSFSRTFHRCSEDYVYFSYTKANCSCKQCNLSFDYYYKGKLSEDIAEKQFALETVESWNKHVFGIRNSWESNKDSAPTPISVSKDLLERIDGVMGALATGASYSENYKAISVEIQDLLEKAEASTNAE